MLFFRLGRRVCCLLAGVKQSKEKRVPQQTAEVCRSSIPAARWCHALPRVVLSGVIIEFSQAELCTVVHCSLVCAYVACLVSLPGATPRQQKHRLHARFARCLLSSMHVARCYSHCSVNSRHVTWLPHICFYCQQPYLKARDAEFKHQGVDAVHCCL